MDKAILVIDMPSCCDECFALDDNGDYLICCITNEQKGYRFRAREQKMDKCPLVAMPSKREHHGLPDDEYGIGYTDGYNVYRDKILGM